jgi:archaellum component FlaG (FlaF/FlaG flagellin family)
MTQINLNIKGENDNALPISFTSSGPGYVGFYYIYKNAEVHKAYAESINLADFTGWTRNGASFSNNYMCDITEGGAYVANFADKKDPLPSDTGLSAGTLSPNFSPTVYKYKILLGENDAGVTITPEKIFHVSGMTINKKNVSSLWVPVAAGKSAKISVVVTQGKAKKTYTFTVTRPKSSNNYLSSLSGVGTWSQGFDPNVMNYTLYLDENTKSTAIKAAAVAGMGAKVSPASKKITLNNGQSKTVKITVKAQSGARRTYVITVVRAKSANADLKSLKAPGISPGFNPAQTNYSITLPANKGSISISAKAAGYKAAVAIDGGKASKKVTLANGQSITVRVVVTSQAGNKKEYVITVTRQ